MTGFVIKIIACITMILDHIKYAIPITNNYFTQYLGRISFPLFAFLVTEGYVHTSDLKRYYKRLILFACISQIPFMLFRTLVGKWQMLNIMFTLLLGLTAILIYDKGKNKIISCLAVIVIIYLGKVLRVDYGWWGVAIIFVIYLFRNKKILLSISYIILSTVYYYLTFGNALLKLKNMYYLIFTIVPIIFILIYNGKQGRKIKYFFYAFYPVHMIILYLLSYITF